MGCGEQGDAVWSTPAPRASSPIDPRRILSRSPGSCGVWGCGTHGVRLSQAVAVPPTSSASARGRDGTLCPGTEGLREDSSSGSGGRWPLVGARQDGWSGAGPTPSLYPSHPGQSAIAVAVGPAKEACSPGSPWPPKSHAGPQAGPPCPSVPVPSTPWCPGHHQAPKPTSIPWREGQSWMGGLGGSEHV